MQRYFRLLSLTAFFIAMVAVPATAQQTPEITAGRTTIDWGDVVLGAQGPSKAVTITVEKLGHHAPPIISWAKGNLAGPNNDNFHIRPEKLRRRALRVRRVTLAEFTCIPRKLGPLEASFQPTVAGTAKTATNPLVTLKCTGVSGIASKATDPVRILWQVGAKALSFKTTEVGGTDRTGVPIQNRTNGPIEVYARFGASAPKMDIDFDRLPPTQKKPLIIEPNKTSGFVLRFDPDIKGNHGRTLEVGWRPKGAKHGWNVKHHVVKGLAIEEELPEDD